MAIKRSKILIATVLLSIPFFTGELHPDALEKTPPDAFSNFLKKFEKNTKKIQLPNGLKILMVKKGSAPIVSCYIKFKAGSSDETSETSGIAHMLEHMLFKGTKQIGTSNYNEEKKYIETSIRWMEKLDYWKNERDHVSNSQYDKETIQKEIEKWESRLNVMSEMTRLYMKPEEDSFLYTIHGQRGFNAYTSHDLTNYQISLPSNKLEIWARIESDRLQNSTLRDFYNERNVVIEERKMRVENVSKSLLFEKFMYEVYGDHPYARPVIGPMNSIQFLSFKKADYFYKTYYAPNNMVIAIVGDIDFDETERLITRYFGQLKPAEIPEVDPDLLKINAKPVDFKLHATGSPLFLMSWFKPPFPDPDDLKLEILSRILADGQDSRLYRKMVIEKRQVTEISIFSSYPGERFTNLFFVYAIPGEKVEYDDIQTSIIEEIEKIKESGVEQDELELVKKNLQKEFIYGLRSGSRIADYLSFYELISEDYRSIFDFYSNIKNITSSDIQEVSKKYLTLNKLMTAKLISK